LTEHSTLSLHDALPISLRSADNQLPAAALADRDEHILNEAALFITERDGGTAHAIPLPRFSRRFRRDERLARLIVSTLNGQSFPTVQPRPVRSPGDVPLRHRHVDCE